jgi:diguanylate cyclase (GGDEF)-like protein/PAS domain S-box-containing protein
MMASMDTAARQPHSNSCPIQSVETWLKLCVAVYDNTSDGVLITNQDGEILLVNNAFTAITGYTQEEVIGKTPRILKSGLHPPKFYEDMWESIRIVGQWQGEIQNKRKDGSIYPEYLNIIAIKGDDNFCSHYVSIFTDLTLRKDAEEFFKYIATHDPLTNLPNRTRFYDYLNNAIYDARINHRQLAVLFIDLDGFKSVNDTFGHETGDQVLQAVADRLLESVPEGAVVSRIGGDEFTVILPEIKAFYQAEQAGRQMIQALSKPLVLEETEAGITASIGISMYPGDGDNAESLLQFADKAMYRVKEAGKNNFAFYSMK